MADDEFHAVAHELVGDRNTFLRIGAVVADEDLDFLPENAAGGVDVLDRLLGAVLELRTEGGASAGDRAGDTQFDLRRNRVCESEAKSEGEAEREPFFHRVYLWMETVGGVCASLRNSIRKSRKCHPDFGVSAAVALLRWTRFLARFQAKWIPVSRPESAPCQEVERVRTQNRFPLLLNALMNRPPLRRKTLSDRGGASAGGRRVR